MSSPIGYRHSTRISYTTTIRPHPTIGMHLNIHKDIKPQFKPKFVTIDYINGPKSLELIDIVLAKQRPYLRNFTGMRMYSGGQIYTHVSHISKSNPYKIAESKGVAPLPSKLPEVPRLIKRTPEEIDEMINRLTQYDPTRHPAEAKRCGFIGITAQKRDTPKSDTKYSSDDVKAIVERISKYDPEKIPESRGPRRGTPTKMNLPIVYKKQYNESEVHAIIDRLNKYDPNKWPPESRGVSPAFLQESTKQTMAKVKKCSPDEVDSIVDRLMQFDSSKWPPESRRFNPNRSTTVTY